MYVTLLPDLFHCLADLGGLLVPLSQGDKVSENIIATQIAPRGRVSQEDGASLD